MQVEGPLHPGHREVSVVRPSEQNLTEARQGALQTSGGQRAERARAWLNLLQKYQGTSVKDWERQAGDGAPGALRAVRPD